MSKNYFKGTQERIDFKESRKAFEKVLKDLLISGELPIADSIHLLTRLGKANNKEQVKSVAELMMEKKMIHQYNKEIKK